MTAPSEPSLYEEVVQVTHAYLGPAANRFVSRQLDSHLGKQPHQLRNRDLNKLIDWISLSMALLVEDEKLIRDYIGELKELATKS